MWLFSWNFFLVLVICLLAKNECDPVILWGDMCDQSILQYNYSKIGNNINIKVRLQKKSMTKFFKIKEKSHFAVIIEHILLFLPKGNFSKKIQLSTIAAVPQHSNVRDTEWIGCQTKNYSITISMQKSFNHSAQFIKLFVIHLI